MSKKIKKLFIANRGEIARRIGITAQRLGIEVVCLCDEKIPQYLTPFVSQWIRVEKLTSKLFLCRESMVKFAVDSKCDAIHPGYGFLAENHKFAGIYTC